MKHQMSYEEPGSGFRGTGSGFRKQPGNHGNRVADDRSDNGQDFSVFLGRDEHCCFDSHSDSIEVILYNIDVTALCLVTKCKQLCVIDH